MEDVASEIIAQLRLGDRPSAFRLTVTGNTDFDCLARKVVVTTPVVDGRIVILVEFVEEASKPDDVPAQRVEYERGAWEGVVSLVDGFVGCGFDGMTLQFLSGTPTPYELCTWECFNRTTDARRGLIKGAVLTLLGQPVGARVAE